LAVSTTHLLEAFSMSIFEFVPNYISVQPTKASMKECGF